MNSEVLNTLVEDDIKVDVYKAEGEKCERCWKYRELNTDNAHPSLCRDCLEAIKE